MDLFAIDDAAQPKPTRDGMGPLVAVGGLHVDGSGLRDLEQNIDRLCGIPAFRTSGVVEDTELREQSLRQRRLVDMWIGG